MTLALPMRLAVSARLLLLQAGFAEQRMQGPGFAYAIEPWLRRCYPDPEKRAAALRRHFEFFNTHPFVAPAIAGMVCALERRAAGGEEAAARKLAALKKAAGAAMAGMGDALFWGALRPACAALAAAAVFALAGGLGWTDAAIAGALLSWLVYNAVAVTVRWAGLARGFSLGERLPLALQELRVQLWIKRVRRAGIALALAALGAALWSSAPQARLPGLLAAAGYLAALRLWPARATIGRLYLLTAAAGAAASAAGWR